jgi:hypothetical protein
MTDSVLHTYIHNNLLRPMFEYPNIYTLSTLNVSYSIHLRRTFIILPHDKCLL